MAWKFPSWDLGSFRYLTLKRVKEAYLKRCKRAILRWLIQRNVVVIPKSVHLDRIVENFSVFDFELSPEDMVLIAKLDTKASSFLDHRDPETVKRLGNVKLNI
jgi:2,5-diketo-D-gluconate reductase A